MAEEAPGRYARIDCRLWTSDFMLLSKAAQRGWLLLTLSSKDRESDGIVGQLHLRQCDVSDEERDELIAAHYLLERAPGKWYVWD